MPESIHERIRREREAKFPRPKKVIDFRKYAEGIQRGTLTPAQRQILVSVMGHDLVDNVCDVVLSAAASRLLLTGFLVEDSGASDWLEGFFTKNELDDFSFDVHYRADRDGNHAVGLRWVDDDKPDDPTVTEQETEPPASIGEGRVTVHHEPWWNGETGVFVAYDGDRPTYAVKDFDQWIGDPPRKKRRRTVYWPNRIERYIRGGENSDGGWSIYQLPNDPTWPVSWTKRNGTPLGLPIVHFPNSRFGKGTYGVSDLDGVLGLQDEINDIQRDITAASRLLGFPMIKLIGVPDTTRIKVAPGQAIGVPLGGDVGILEPGDLSQLISSYLHKLQTVGRNTQTPFHFIGAGDWPAGIALIRAEMPLVSKVERKAKSYGPRWRTVAHRSTEISNAFGRDDINEDALITTRFAPPEKLDEQILVDVMKTRAEAFAALLALGSPKLIAMTGAMTEEEAAEILGQQNEFATVAEF